MAEIVLALGASHRLMLCSPADDILRHGERDRRNPAWLDRNGQPVMEAFLSGDTDALGCIDPGRLNSGSSEIRNWVTVGAAAAAAGLQRAWVICAPFYRTKAGSGCGMGYAALRIGPPN